MQSSSAPRAGDPPRLQALLAFGVFASQLLLTAGMCWIFARPAGALALAAVLAYPLARGRPGMGALLVVAAGVVVRAALVGTGPATDQIEVTQAALRLALAGGNPYGAGIAGTSTGAPFPYGPLALVAYIPGAWTEVAAAAGTMLVLAHRRALVSLALYAACPLFVRATVMGINDVLPGLLITLAVLAGASRPTQSGVLLAAAIGIKPYAAAWLPGLLGAGGAAFAVAFGAASVAVWSPLLAWGPASYAASVMLGLAQHPRPPGAVDLTPLRLLALPMAAVALLRSRSLEAQVAAGTAIFLVVMVLADVTSVAYLLAPLPLVAVVLEERLAARLARSS